MTSTTTPAEATNGPEISPVSPADSVILDVAAPGGFANDGFGKIAKSDALRQPLVSLDARLKTHLDAWSAQRPLSHDINQFLDFVAALRLKHMPNKGSKWDKILQQSTLFAGQVHRYNEVVAETLIGSSKVAAIIYSCLHVILEVSFHPKSYDTSNSLTRSSWVTLMRMHLSLQLQLLMVCHLFWHISFVKADR